jgi:hypothetical protein
METTSFLRSSAGVGDAERPLSLQVQTGDHASRGFYTALAWSQAVALVPEPQQWAMWLAALAVAGAARWRLMRRVA